MHANCFDSKEIILSSSEIKLHGKSVIDVFTWVIDARITAPRRPIHYKVVPAILINTFPAGSIIVLVNKRQHYILITDRPIPDLVAATFS